MKVLVIGNTTLDVLCPVDGPVGSDYFGKLVNLKGHIVADLGGNGAIASVVLSHFRNETALVTSIGQDLMGRMAMARLDQAGVTVFNAGSGTAKTVVLISPGGERALLHDSEGENAITVDDVYEAMEYVRPDALFLTSYFLLPSIGSPEAEDILRTARKIGMRTYLDTCWDPSGLWDMGGIPEHLDVLFANEAEGENLDLESIREQCTVVVKRGEKGAVMYTSGGEITASAPRITAVDTTGAGDVFCGAFISAHLRGWKDEMTLQNAVEFASSSVTKFGGVSFLDRI